MQYGVVVFKNTDNMGDDIQAYAASRFYPQIDYFINRENLDSFYSYNQEQVAVIMAGWYTHSPLNWPPSPYIYPLTVYMHFAQDIHRFFENSELNPLDDDCCRDWFEKWGSVGCRDNYTMNMLQQLGISTWLSGCITLTLEPFQDVLKHGKIVCVDVEDAVCKLIQESTTHEIEFCTHEYKENKTIETRMDLVEERSRFYQGAGLVITSRLHCVLPCTALGVPVIYVTDSKTDHRFETYFKI